MFVTRFTARKLQRNRVCSKTSPKACCIGTFFCLVCGNNEKKNVVSRDRLKLLLFTLSARRWKITYSSTPWKKPLFALIYSHNYTYYSIDRVQYWIMCSVKKMISFGNSIISFSRLNLLSFFSFSILTSFFSPFLFFSFSLLISSISKTSYIIISS